MTDTIKTQEAAKTAARENTPDGWRARLRGVLQASMLYLLAALAILIIIFGAMNPGAFLGAYNLREVFTEAALLLIVAVGATFVIATSGIDLSVGGVLVFSGVISTEAMSAVGGKGWGAVAVGLATSLACGAIFGWISGLLVAKAHIPPLIATLGILGVSLGLAQVVTNGADLSGIPETLTNGIGLGQLFSTIPWIVVIAAVVTVWAAISLRSTRFGQYTLAIGSNKEGARRAGIQVDRHLIKIYVLAGTLAGLAGFLNLARFATTSIAGHSTDNLQAISAVVLGGTSLFGGWATIAGTVIGVFIPTILQNGFVISGVPPFWQQVAIGVVLVIAVYIDQLRRRSRDK